MGEKTYIYVLELEGLTPCGSRRIYVGKSSNVEYRYEKHSRGEGSEYTRQHSPKHLLEMYDAGSEEDALKMEDTVTEKYILRFGVGVRGGHYLQETDVLSVLKKEQHLKNLCYKCGLSGHYSKKCHQSLLQKIQIEHVKKESESERKERLASIKVTLWSSGSSKYEDEIVSLSSSPSSMQSFQVNFGAQTHANNKNHKVQVGALFCDTSGGGWTVRGLVSAMTFNAEKNAFLLTVTPMPESGLSIRSTIQEHGKVGIAKALGLPLPSYNWTSSGIVVHRS